MVTKFNQLRDRLVFNSESAQKTPLNSAYVDRIVARNEEETDDEDEDNDDEDEDEDEDETDDDEEPTDQWLAQYGRQVDCLYFV